MRIEKSCTPQAAAIFGGSRPYLWLRRSPQQPRAWPASVALLATLVLLAACFPAAAQSSHPSPPADPQPLACIDAKLAHRHWAAALDLVRDFERQHGPTPPVDFRAAQAWFGLGQILGKVTVRQITNGRLGQFSGDFLLVEQRGPDRFLCCTKDSALFRLRRALDAGFDQPAAHLLHARLWLALGKPELALALAKAHEPAILADAQPTELDALADIALQAGAPDDYLRYMRLRAARDPQEHDQTLAKAYLGLADYYAQRGDHDLEREFCYRAACLRPNDPALALRLADAEWLAQHYEPAARHYRQYLLHSPPQDAERQRVLERLATTPANSAAP
jgi:hypothetical protein